MSHVPSILTGFDKDGRPILYMRPGRENTQTSPRQLRHLVWCLWVFVWVLTITPVDVSPQRTRQRPHAPWSGIVSNHRRLQDHYPEDKPLNFSGA